MRAGRWWEQEDDESRKTMRAVMRAGRRWEQWWEQEGDGEMGSDEKRDERRWGTSETIYTHTHSFTLTHCNIATFNLCLFPAATTLRGVLFCWCASALPTFLPHKIANQNGLMTSTQHALRLMHSQPSFHCFSLESELSRLLEEADFERAQDVVDSAPVSVQKSLQRRLDKASARTAGCTLSFLRTQLLRRRAPMHLSDAFIHLTDDSMHLSDAVTHLSDAFIHLSDASHTSDAFKHLSDAFTHTIWEHLSDTFIPLTDAFTHLTVKASERCVDEAISEEERCVKASVRCVCEGIRELCEGIKRGVWRRQRSVWRHKWGVKVSERCVKGAWSHRWMYE
jgi:hypothetical protein